MKKILLFLYLNLTEDIVRTKNRLHKCLQVIFPELENLLSKPTSEQYWNLVIAFPSKEFVLHLTQSELIAIIRQSTTKHISKKRIIYLSGKLTELAKQSYCEVKKTSPMLEEVRYYAQKLLRLFKRRQVDLNIIVSLAQSLSEYDILLYIPGIAETTATSIIGELEIFVGFSLPTKSMPLLGLILDTMSFVCTFIAAYPIRRGQ